MSSLTLGIDLGTSACRVALIDAADTVVSLAREPLPALVSNGAHCEQRPADWWTSCEQALDTALGRVDCSNIRALAIDGTSSSLLLCDAAGTPGGPALMYRDQRATTQAERLSAIAPATAAVHGASSSLAKLLWLADNGQLREGLTALHQADWLAARFTGRYDVSDENNALKLGYDAVTRRWPDWLGQLDLPGCLPRVVPAGSPLGPVSPGMAQRFGLATDCLVVAGTTDSTASFIAAGASRVGEAVTVLGSTLVVKILSERPVFAPQFGVYSHRLGDLWLVGGASNTGGAVLQQFFDNEQLASLSRQINPAHPSGLNYYPLPATGERFPINDPQLAPELVPRPADDVQFLHGLFEGMANIERRGYELLAELGAPAPLSIRTVGGGAHNPAWLAIRQRYIDAAFVAAAHDEAAVGSAMLARNALAR